MAVGRATTLSDSISEPLSDSSNLSVVGLSVAKGSRKKLVYRAIHTAEVGVVPEVLFRGGSVKVRDLFAFFGRSCLPQKWRI